LTDDIRKKQNIVDDLQRKLNAAIADRDSAQKDLNIAQISKSRIPPEITSLKNLLQRL
jgi:hypothetical protein